MIKTSIDTDLVRLRQFLTRLEADAQIAVGDVDLDGQEIESLKREIAYIEGILNGDVRTEGIPIPDSDRLRLLAASPVIWAATFSAPQLITRADTTKSGVRD